MSSPFGGAQCAQLLMMLACLQAKEEEVHGGDRLPESSGALPGGGGKTPARKVNYLLLISTWYQENPFFCPNLYLCIFKLILEERKSFQIH